MDLSKIIQEWEGYETHLLIGEEEGHYVELVNYTIHEPSTHIHILGSAQMLRELLEDVNEFLSLFCAVFLPHGKPEHITETSVEYVQTYSCRNLYIILFLFYF